MPAGQLPGEFRCQTEANGEVIRCNPASSVTCLEHTTTGGGEGEDEAKVGGEGEGGVHGNRWGAVFTCLHSTACWFHCCYITHTASVAMGEPCSGIIHQIQAQMNAVCSSTKGKDAVDASNKSKGS